MSGYLKEGAVDLFMTYKFIRLLTTKWNKTDAYKTGVIDDKGKLLVKGKDQTEKQKNLRESTIRKISDSFLCGRFISFKRRNWYGRRRFNQSLRRLRSRYFN